MKLNVFLSWSGTRSKLIATKLSNWLPKVLHVVKPWVSSEKIMKGDRWWNIIEKELDRHNIGIICLTPENLKSEWLNFEAGAISKAMQESSVFPLLFGIPIKNFEGPLAQFQYTLFIKEDLFTLIKSLNNLLQDDKISEEILKSSFEYYWNEMQELYKELSNVELEFNETTLPKLLEAMSHSDLPIPLIQDSVFFNEGFESHTLYNIVTKIVGKRLFNFSRLNRKLFEKDYKDFWVSIKQKVDNGFELKLLFLDPESPAYIIENSHSDFDFREQIISELEHAKKIFSDCGLNINDYCRTYSSIRTIATTVMDDAVLFSPILFNTNNSPKPITKSSFTIIHAVSNLGRELIDDINYKWTTGKLIV